MMGVKDHVLARAYSFAHCASNSVISEENKRPEFGGVETRKIRTKSRLGITLSRLIALHVVCHVVCHVVAL